MAKRSWLRSELRVWQRASAPAGACAGQRRGDGYACQRYAIGHSSEASCRCAMARRRRAVAAIGWCWRCKVFASSGGMLAAALGACIKRSVTALQRCMAREGGGSVQRMPALRHAHAASWLKPWCWWDIIDIMEEHTGYAYYAAEAFRRCHARRWCFSRDDIFSAAYLPPDNIFTRCRWVLREFSISTDWQLSPMPADAITPEYWPSLAAARVSSHADRWHFLPPQRCHYRHAYDSRHWAAHVTPFVDIVDIRLHRASRCHIAATPMIRRLRCHASFFIIERCRRRMSVCFSYTLYLSHDYAIRIFHFIYLIELLAAMMLASYWRPHYTPPVTECRHWWRYMLSRELTIYITPRWCHCIDDSRFSFSNITR